MECCLAQCRDTNTEAVTDADTNIVTATARFNWNSFLLGQNLLGMHCKLTRCEYQIQISQIKQGNEENLPNNAVASEIKQCQQLL